MTSRRSHRRRRLSRLWWLLLLVPIAPIVGVAAALWLTLPPSHATLRLHGLGAPVDVTLDRWGVPRIHARTEADAAAALGYLHARDRMFQMELMRRQASGRLAEIAGPRAVRLDRMARIFGERRHAQASYATLPADLRAILQAYAAGVNAWIAERGRLAAPEFLLLGTPEPWTPTDSLLWSETVSLWLSDNFRTELSRATLSAKVPMAKLLQLWPPTADTPAPDGTAPQAPTRQGSLDALPAWPQPFTWPAEASNAWAVDGRHTATGAPLLAGDPHLGFGFPGLWYLARIETPGAVMVGATAPGVPFLILGRNARVAWSFTTTGIDTQDVFVETTLPGGTTYATPDGPRPFETRQEVIHVRGAPDVVLTVRATRHGPVISDPAPGETAKPGGPVLAVSMAQLQLGSPVPGIHALDLAASLAEAGHAAATMTAPMQNLTVADGDGIALYTTGQVPVRRAGDGAVPVDGADGAHDWTGFASGDALPHFVHPASGTVENANERTAPPSFPVYLGRDFPGPIRARRIHELLAAKSSFGIADFEAMQRDDVSVFAHDVLPVLRALPRQAGLTGRTEAMLEAWDGRMDKGRPEPLIFNAAAQLFVSQVLAANHVPEADSGPWGSFAEWLLTPAGAPWCGGDCPAALGRALHDATEDLAKTFGRDPTAWRWGEAHKAVFAHPLLGDLPVIGRLASRRVAVDGDDTTLFRGGNGTLGEFTAVHGAGFRGVYDLADLDRSRFVVTPGQSGNLLSPHAWDLLPLWARGDTVALPAAPDGVTATLHFDPG